MYILFREFHWRPSDFYLLPEGEKIVVRAFLAKLVDEKEKEARDFEKRSRQRRGKR
jgi:hypothetical protein